MVGILGILIALGLLIYLSYRGFSVLLLAPLMALVAVLLGGAPLLASYTQIFMPAMGSFIVQFFPLFLLGALFDKLMEDTGSARALAEAIVARLGEVNTIPAIVLACAVLTYGGVSLFVVAFAVYPIAAAMFERARLPRTLIPASIALGAFTFTMTALPGTPAIQNAIPMPYFGTTAFAAPGIGIIAGAIMLGLGLLWIMRRATSWSGAVPACAEIRSRPPKELRELAQGEGFDLTGLGEQRSGELPPVWIAALPIVLVVVLNFLLATILLPMLDTGYLAEKRYGGVSFGAVRGVWAILLALAISVSVMAVLNRGRLPNLKQTLGDGANAATGPAFNTASLVGFGAVIASLSAFDIVRDAVLGIAPGNPLISLAVAVNILAGITGSASGGMSIALQTLGATYLELGRAAGIHPDLLHRVTAIATGGLDALPHNGAVITLLSVCNMTHREAYKDIFVVACAVPLVALLAILILANVTGSF
ncbi:GntP family permease [Bradyrhizobium sp.]|uniref:GntP family permease n=1 Tax=Bradyrhizobium sp. TaxID=376 RepID=UPI002736A713|nr:GntP family permease [Bradyrhizobium sp.]MDP3693718.1 GntP family permease [Bradyrhizobium sp.]